MPIKEIMQKFTKNYKSSDILCPGDIAWLIKMQLESPMYEQVGWKDFIKTIHSTVGNAQSEVDYLPISIINGPPDDFSTIYTTLRECMKSANSEVRTPNRGI